jgi:hypothetical protein
MTDIGPTESALSGKANAVVLEVSVIDRQKSRL